MYRAVSSKRIHEKLTPFDMTVAAMKEQAPSLATVMPRSGGDYVFTSRLIPGIGPFLAWVESFTLVFASLAVIAFEIPIVLHNTQISGDIIGIGTGVGFFKRANGWFTSGGSVTGWPGMIAALVVIALILLVVVQPTRRFHRIVTGLGAFGLLSWIVMWVFGLLFVHRASFEANLPRYTGMTAAALQKAAVTGGVLGHGFSWSTTVLPFLMSVILFQYIGFQYSAYIAGEVRGNLKRGILMQPGGHVERAEDPWAAVAHELREESGYDLEQLLLLQPAHRIERAEGVAVLPTPLVVDVHPITDDHAHTDIVYAFVATTDPAGAPGEDESQELHWLPVDELDGPDAPADLAPGLAEVALYAIDAMKSSILVTVTPPRANTFAVSTWWTSARSR